MHKRRALCAGTLSKLTENSNRRRALNCQCRNERMQQSHIGCAILVWVRLTALAHQAKTTVYQLKRGLLDEYLKQQLKNPKLTFALA